MRHKVAKGNIYHVLNRGVDKRKVFLDNWDYLRFIHDLYQFNDSKIVLNNKNSFLNFKGVEHPYFQEKRDLLVEILAFCLMPNHYHLLLRPKTNTGLAEFMKKINGGYTNYFNVKYERTGSLFGGRYKSIPIVKDSHLRYVPYYIHLNPLDLVMPSWRDGEIADVNKATVFLEKYRWSSHLDYLGSRNFPSLTQRKFLTDLFGGENRYKKDFVSLIKNLNENFIADVSFE